MKKAKILALVAGIVATVMFVAAPVSVALAQTDSSSSDYTYDYTTDYGTSTSTSADDAAAFLGSGVGLLISCCCGIIGLIIFVLWVMSFIDCLQNASPDKKTLWIILLLLLPITSLYYFFALRGKWGNVVAVPVAGPVQPVA